MSALIAAAGMVPDLRIERRRALCHDRAEADCLEAEAASLREFASWVTDRMVPPAPRAKSVDELPAMQRWRMRARPPRARAGWVPTRPATVPAPVVPDRVAVYMSQPELVDERWSTRLRAWAVDWLEWLKPSHGAPTSVAREVQRRQDVLAPLATPRRTGSSRGAVVA